MKKVQDEIHEIIVVQDMEEECVVVDLVEET